MQQLKCFRMKCRKRESNKSKLKRRVFSCFHGSQAFQPCAAQPAGPDHMTSGTCWGRMAAEVLHDDALLEACCTAWRLSSDVHKKLTKTITQHGFICSSRSLRHTHDAVHALVECCFHAVLIFMRSLNGCGFYSWALSALHFINIIRTMSAEPLNRVMACFFLKKKGMDRCYWWVRIGVCLGY